MYTHKDMHNNIDMIDVLDTDVNILHANYVVVNADKASNNIIIICKHIL